MTVWNTWLQKVWGKGFCAHGMQSTEGEGKGQAMQHEADRIISTKR